MLTRNDAAWDLWQRGLTVLPAHPVQKAPLVRWQRYQVEDVDEETMTHWCSSSRFANCNWALVTGKEYCVVDADSPEAIQWVISTLPWTPLRVKTSRGKHFYYRTNPSIDVKTVANPHAKLDVRGHGGIVIAPGSIHETGVVYELDIDAGIDDPFDGVPFWGAYFLGAIERENEGTATARESNNVVSMMPQGGWHDRMIREVASKLMLGYTDAQIMAEADDWTEPGYTVQQTRREFKAAIAGARSKWGEDIEAKAQAAEQPMPQVTSNDLAPQPFAFIDAADIPKREWVYGRHYIRRFLSVTVAQGGSGKTALTLAEAVSMASGQGFLGIEAPQRKVWVWNLEDPLEELQRRIAAICAHYAIDSGSLRDQLFVNSGRDNALVIADTVRGEAALTPAVDHILQHIQQHQIDVIIVDPFVSSHRLSETDNGQMDLVVKAWGRVAELGNCAVELVHHVRKPSAQQAASYSDARGASALTDAARHVRRLQRMTAEEARMAGIEESDFWQYSRDVDSKDNLAPPSASSNWRRMVSVDLANGDSVGVIEQWQWPNVFDDITVNDLERVRAALASGEYRADVRSQEWAGRRVAEVLGLDVTDDLAKSQIKTFLKTWIANGQLRVVTRFDAQSKNRQFIEVVSDGGKYEGDF